MEYVAEEMQSLKENPIKDEKRLRKEGSLHTNLFDYQLQAY